jgi:hypothetical protein
MRQDCVKYRKKAGLEEDKLSTTPEEERKIRGQLFFPTGWRIKLSDSLALPEYRMWKASFFKYYKLYLRCLRARETRVQGNIVGQKLGEKTVMGQSISDEKEEKDGEKTDQGKDKADKKEEKKRTIYEISDDSDIEVEWVLSIPLCVYLNLLCLHVDVRRRVLSIPTASQINPAFQLQARINGQRNRGVFGNTIIQFHLLSPQTKENNKADRDMAL